MKKLFIFLALSALCISVANANSTNITCPSALQYECKTDPTCPKTRCTLTSYAHPAWIFLAPARELEKSPAQNSCSILPPGNYVAGYLASIYGPVAGIGNVAYCLYGSINDISFSGLYTPKYKMGDGHWQASPPSFVCTPANECQFTPV